MLALGSDMLRPWMLVESVDRTSLELLSTTDDPRTPSDTTLEALLDGVQMGGDGRAYAHASDGAVYRIHEGATLELIARQVGSRYAVGSDTTLWYVRAGKLYYLTEDSRLKTWPLDARAEPPVRYVAAAADGAIWFSTDTKLCSIRTGAQTCFTIDPNIWLGPIFPQDDGSVWFAAGPDLLGRFSPVSSDFHPQPGSNCW